MLLDRFSTKSGYDMMLSLIHSDKLPTAIFITSAPLAIGAMNALRDCDYSIPEDISIINFDDTDASGSTPSLTTIHTLSYQMGSYGAGIIYNLLGTKGATPMKIKLPCSLVIRNSVQKI